MFDEEPADALGIMAADLRDARGQVDAHVGMAVQGAVDPVNFLGVVAKMHAHEGGVGVPAHDAVQGFQERLPGRVFVGVAEPPALVVLEFFPALVGFVEGLPEGLGIARVNGDGHAQLSAAAPDAVEPGIVHRDKPAAGIAQEQPQPLELFQPGGARAAALVDLFGGRLGEPGFVPPGIVQVHVMDEPPREQGVGLALVLFEGRGRAVGPGGDGSAVQVHGHADPGGIVDPDGPAQALGLVGDVLVQVDEAALGAPNVRLGAGQGRFGGGAACGGHEDGKEERGKLSKQEFHARKN